jgi:hypothetical protein
MKLYHLLILSILVFSCKDDDQKCNTHIKQSIEKGRIVTTDSSYYLNTRFINLYDSAYNGVVWTLLGQYLCDGFSLEDNQDLITLIDLNNLDSGVLYTFKDAEIPNQLMCYSELIYNSENDKKEDNGVYRINDGELSIEKKGEEWSVIMNVTFAGESTGIIYSVIYP